MSYSVSTSIFDEFKIKEIADNLQNEIDKETYKLKKSKINISNETVFINDEIPYSPTIENIIGIHLHSLDELSLNYYFHKIINIAKEYGEKNYCKNLDIYFYNIYYDDEKFNVVSNNDWSNKNLLKNTNIIYEDRFSIIKNKQNITHAIKNYFFERNMKKMKNIILS